MKARESVKNYPSALREMTNYSARSIKKICTEVGARPSASEQEFEAQKRMSAELEQCCDKVQTEEFKVCPSAFLGSVIVTCVLIAAAIAMIFMDLTIVSIVLGALALVIILGLALHKNFLAPLFPKKVSHNIIGIKNASNIATRRIVFSANCDSKTSKDATGANRNLSGCFAALSVVRFLQRQNIQLANTEIWIVLTGSGELQSCGAKAFAKAHNFDDIETVFVSFDTLIDQDRLTVCSNDSEATALIKNAAQTADCKISDGKATADILALSKNGAKAACVCAFDKNSLKAKADNADALSIKTIETCVDIALEAAFLFDGQGS